MLVDIKEHISGTNDHFDIESSILSDDIMVADYVNEVKHYIQEAFTKITASTALLSKDDYTITVTGDGSGIEFIVRITGIQHVSHHVSIPLLSFERGQGLTSVEESLSKVISSLYAGKKQTVPAL